MFVFKNLIVILVLSFIMILFIYINKNSYKNLLFLINNKDPIIELEDENMKIIDNKNQKIEFNINKISKINIKHTGDSNIPSKMFIVLENYNFMNSNSKKTKLCIDLDVFKDAQEIIDQIDNHIKKYNPTF